ncbi:MAG: hypothetical protein ACQESD_01260 [Thermoplasmatota archaeon]
MQDDTDDQQDYGERREPEPDFDEPEPCSSGQGQQYQQQPPPPPPSQRPPKRKPDPDRSKKMMVLAGLVAAIILVAAFFIFYTQSKGLVGKWEYTDSETQGQYTAEITMTINLKDDGTGEMIYEISMNDQSQSESSDFEWEKTDDGEIEITQNGQTDTIEYEMRDGGDTLVIISEDFSTITGSDEMEFERV